MLTVQPFLAVPLASGTVGHASRLLCSQGEDGYTYLMKTSCHLLPLPLCPIFPPFHLLLILFLVLVQPPVQSTLSDLENFVMET